MTVRDAITQMQRILDEGAVTWTPNNEIHLTVKKHAIDFDSIRTLLEFGLGAKLESSSAQRLFDSGGAGKIDTGMLVELTVPRQWGELVIARNIDDLLSFPNAHTSVPAAYLLLELQEDKPSASFVNGDSTNSFPAIQHRYHQAVELWHLLKSSADHESAEGNLMFFGPKPSEIKPGFDRENLERKPLWEPRIRKFITDPDRQEVRRQIFRACLADLLRDTTPENAFRCFLQSTDVFERHLREGLAIYLADNAPEKLASEGRASAMALSESLEKIISGLEAKGLTVPAALLLAVKDMQPGGGLGGMNAVIWASLLTFAATMFFIDKSQKALICQLIATIDGATDDLKRKGLAEDNPVIAKRFKTLKERAENAKTWSLVVCILSFVPVLVVLYMSHFGTPRPTTPAADRVPKLMDGKK